MAVTRIKNNQITDATIVASSKLQDYSVSATKIANNLTYGSNLTVTGNLTVQGNTTTIDTNITTIEDPVIVLASTQSGSPAVDIGFIGQRGTSDNVAFVWDESQGKFVTVFTSTAETNTTISISSYASVKTLDAVVTGNLDVTAASNIGNLTVAANSVVSFGNVVISNVANPIANTDAATKAYVLDQLGNSSFDITDGSTTEAVNGGDTIDFEGTTDQITLTVASVSGNTSSVTAALDTNVSVTGNVTVGNVLTVTGTVNSNLVPTTDSVYNLGATGALWKDLYLAGNSIYIGTQSITSNAAGITLSNTITGGNVATGGTVSATGTVTGGNLETGGTVSATGTVTGGNLSTGGTATVTGNITGGNVLTGGRVSATGDINGGNIYTGGELSATANVTGGNIYTGGLVSATTTITAGGNVTGGNILTGGVVSSTGTVTGGNLATGGTVNATGTVTGGNLETGGTVSATGNVTGGNVLTGGIVSATGNITSAALGTFGNINSNGFVSAVGNINGEYIIANTGFRSPAVVITSTTANTGISLVTNGTGNINVNTSYLNNLKDPQQAQDAATKGYVDALVEGLDPKASVHTATVTGLPTYTYDNGTAGVGATLTANAVGNLVVDGQTILANQRVLVKNETSGNAPYNGIYLCTTQGTPSAAYVLTRATDFNTPVEMYSAFTFVETGNTTADTGWVCTNNAANPITVGTTAIVFTQFSGAGQYTAGNALSLNGTQFNVNTDQSADNTIGINGSNELYIPAGAVLTTPNIGEATGTSLSATGNVTGGNVLTGGLVSATGDITGGNLVTGGTVSATGNITSSANITGGNVLTGGVVSSTGNVTGGNVLTGGLVSATGDITGGNLVTGGTATVTGNITGGNVLTGGIVSATGDINGGNIYTGGELSATANITGGNIITAGLISATSTITSAANISGANLTTGGTVSATGTVTGGNLATGGTVTATGNITGGNILTSGSGGDISGSGNVTGGNLNTGGTVNATGTVTGGNIATGGTVSAAGNITANSSSFFIGNGSQLTGVLASSAIALVNGNTNVTTALNGNANVTIGGTSNVVVWATTGEYVTGVVSASGNVTGANVIGTTAVIGGNIVISGDDITDTNGRVNFNTAGADVDFAVNGDTVANVFYVDAGTGTASFGNSTQITNAVVAFNATNSILFPVGNSAQRPATGVTGMIRFNTSTNAVEVYNNTQWDTVGTPAFTVITDNQFNGDNSTVAFTLTQSSTTAGTIVAINGVQQIPTTAYAISGTTLTFTEAPSDGDVIDVRIFTTTTSVTSISNGSGNAVVATSDTAALVNVTGDLSVSGTILGGNINSTAITNGTSNVSVVSSGGNVATTVAGSTILTVSPGLVDIQGNLTVSGNATLSGNILGDRIQNGTTSLDIQAPNGNANISVGGTSNVAVFSPTIVTMAANLLPSANVTYDLGTTTQRWKDLYLANSTIYLGNSTISANATAIIMTNPAGGQTVLAGASGATALTGATVSATGNITGGNVMTGGVVNATGNVVGGNVLTAGLISATGAITGAALTGTSLTVSTGNITAGNIVNSNANGVGNIGSSTTYFNTVFAKATSAQYADLAEKYEADAEYAPGTVVAFGGAKEVTLATEDGSTRVAGVVSTNPSYIMNAALEAEHVAMVALQGRVPCRVIGPVAKGDMMVAAGNGAARVDNAARAGSIIGKALENFDGAEGTIEVVVGRN